MNKSLKLNENEKRVFIALGQEILNSTGGQFGYASEADIPEGISQNQFKGYVSQLKQKGLFTISDDEFSQMMIGENFQSFAESNNLFTGQSFEIGLDFITIENKAGENIQMAKKQPKKVTEVLEAVANHASFEIVLSGNGKNLVKQLSSGKKSFTDLSERDASTWSAVQRAYDEWKAGAQTDAPEAKETTETTESETPSNVVDFDSKKKGKKSKKDSTDETSSDETATEETSDQPEGEQTETKDQKPPKPNKLVEEKPDDIMVYAGTLKDGITALEISAAVKKLIPSYTEKSAASLLKKGKAILTTDSETFYCGDAEVLKADLNDKAKVLDDLQSEVAGLNESSQETANDQPKEDQEETFVDTTVEYDLSQVNEITGEIGTNSVFFLNSNAELASKLFGIDVIETPTGKYADFPTEDLTKHLTTADEAKIRLLLRDGDDATETETEGEVVNNQIDSEEMMDVSIGEFPGENNALAIVEPKGDLLDVIETEEDFSNFGDLSENDVKDLERIENEIIDELPNWEKSNDFLGLRFAELTNRKLYRQTHKSFPKYVLEKFGVTKAKAYQLIISAEIRTAIASGDGGNEVKILPSQRATQTLNQISTSVKELLQNNHSVREIDNYDNQLHKAIWDITLQSAPRDPKTNEPMITPAHLASVKETVQSIVQTGTLNIDGEDVPLELVPTYANASITEETHERTNRQKTKIAEDIKKSREVRSEGQERVPTKTHETKMKEKGLNNKLANSCSCGGEGCDKIKKIVFGGIKMQCGHGFIKVAGKDELVETDEIV